MQVKRSYRELEKISIKLIKIKCHLKFNETCIINNLLPCYSNIRIHDDAARSESFVLEFRRNLILRQIEEQKKQITELIEELKVCKPQFSSLVNSPLRFSAFMFFLQRACNKVQSEVSDSQNRKLVNLYGDSILQKQTKDSAINLSSREIPLPVLEVMSLGMNCHIKQKADENKKKVAIEKLYNDIVKQEKCNSVKINDNERLKTELRLFGVKKCSEFHKDILTKEQYNTVRNFMQENTDIIIRKADKSNVFVIMDRDKYTSKISAMLSDENKFLKMEHDPSENLNKLLNEQISKVNAVKDGVRLNKLVGHFEMGYIYGNPKVHKNAINPPLRPIVSQVGTAVASVAAQINDIIKQYIPSRFMVGSTYEFLQLINTCEITQSCKIASLDVESLFTNIPVIDTIDIVLKHVYNHPTIPPPKMPMAVLKELLILCTTKAPFRNLNGDIYMQVDGVIMGSNLGPTFANYYMAELESNVFSSYPNAKPRLYARYVDDIFLIIDNNDALQEIKTLFESNSILKFTYEEEKHNRLAFLDVLVNRQENKFSTSVYIKPTHSNDCLNYNGVCPDRYKISTINTLINRAYRVCSDWHTFHSEIERIKQLLTDNNFPMAVIDESIRKFISKKQCVQIPDPPSPPHISLYYCSQMTSDYKQQERNLKNIVHRSVTPVGRDAKINLHVFYRNRTVRKLFIHNKVYRCREEFNVVYRYTCNIAGCNSAQYIGYTEQTLSGRFRQHKSIKEHLSIVHDRRYVAREVLQSVDVIGRGNYREELLILEALLIKQHKPTLNRQEEGRDRVLNVF